MNVEFINPFLESILNVLATMAQMEATAEKPFLKKNSIAKGDVTGIIGMAGEQTKGSLAITFTEKTIIHITSQMLGEEIELLDETAIEMAGEITNMVTGGAKAILANKGYKFELAIPSMVVGKDHIISHNSNGPIIIVPFTTSAGDFFIELCFES